MSLILMGISVCLILFIIKKIYIRNWHKGISAEIDISRENTFPGEELMLTETIINRKWLPLPMIQVKFEIDRSFVFGDEVVNVNVSDHCYKSDIFSLLFYQKITRKLPFTCTHRGYFTIEDINVVSTDVMMDTTLAKIFYVGKSITVYPAEVSCEEVEIPYRKIMGTVLTSRYAYEDPFEFRGIREYQTYDSLKDINWMASARTGELKVNIHGYTASRQVALLINLENDGIWEYEQLKEKSISMALSLACRLIEQGVAVSLLSNGRDKISGREVIIQSGCDENHKINIMTQLARIDLKKQPSDFETVIEKYRDELGKDALYCMISTSRRKELQLYYNDIAAGNEGSVWIYPYNTGFETCFDYINKAEIICWEVNNDTESGI